MLTGQAKLTRFGSLSNLQTASLIVAKSTNAGKPLHKSNASQLTPAWFFLQEMKGKP